MSQIVQLLQKMRNRSGMYLGWPSLSRLSGFLRGYDYALFEVQGSPGSSFLLRFQAWIERRLEVKHEWWESAILKQSASEAEALDRFWVLFDEYLAEQELLEDQENDASPTSLADSNEPQP